MSDLKYAAKRIENVIDNLRIQCNNIQEEMKYLEEVRAEILAQNILADEVKGLLGGICDGMEILNVRREPPLIEDLQDK